MFCYAVAMFLLCLLCFVALPLCLAMFSAMSCYDFAMFRKAGEQRGGTGHGRARRRRAIPSTPVLPVLSEAEGSAVEGND